MGRKKNQTSVKQVELRWVLTSQIQEAVMSSLFHRDSSSPFLDERGFLGIIHEGRGVRTRSLFLRNIVEQEKGWVSYGNDAGLSFDPHYFSRALDRLANEPVGSGLIIVHSHPFGGSAYDIPQPSSPDLYHERMLLHQLSRSLPEGSPLAAGIVGGGGGWRVRQYTWLKPKNAEEANSKKFGPENAEYLDATSTRMVSPNSLKVLHYKETFLKRKLNEKTLDSSIKLWGKDGQKILGGLRVGIAGLGGVGSILTEFLARLGIGELILVDFDVVSDENMNRMIGVLPKELGKPKVEYAERIAKNAATYSPFNVHSFRGSVAENDGLRHLLDADIIMNAADSPLARQVLDHASYAFEIPVIDGGTILIVENGVDKMIGKSQISVSGPGQPCLECSGVYSQQSATMARENPDNIDPQRYVQSSDRNTEIPERAPSVIACNGLVASLMVQRMMNMVLGFPPRNKFGQQRYYIEAGILQWAPTEHCEADCPKQEWTGVGDSHQIPTGVDPIWKRMREGVLQ